MNVIEEFVYDGYTYQYLSNESIVFIQRGFQRRRNVPGAEWQSIPQREYDIARKRSNQR